MRSAFLALPVLLGAAPLARAAVPLPTHQQAVAADTRRGSTFDFDGAQVFYQVTGTGTPLVLIHGYPLSSALFTYQQTGLASRFQVITLDLPGFGQSTATSGSASTAYYAQAVLALLDHLGIAKAVIGGHSMGGLVTEELYREVPSRFAGMILIDTVAAAAPTVEKTEWIGYGTQATEQGVPSILPNIVPTLLTGATLLDTPVVGTEIDDIIAEASVDGAQGGAETLVLRPDYTSLLPTIAVPTLVIEAWMTASTRSRSRSRSRPRSRARPWRCCRTGDTSASSSVRTRPTRRSPPGRRPPGSSRPAPSRGRQHAAPSGRWAQDQDCLAGKPGRPGSTFRQELDQPGVAS